MIGNGHFFFIILHEGYSTTFTIICLFLSLAAWIGYFVGKKKNRLLFILGIVLAVLGAIQLLLGAMLKE